MAKYDGKDILFSPQIVGVGASNYNELANKPVINADLDNTAASTADQTVLYHHVGESTATYKKAALYYTDGTTWNEFKGEQGADGKDYLIFGVPFSPIVESGFAVGKFFATDNYDYCKPNRTPVNGDTAIGFVTGANDKKLYILTGTISNTQQKSCWFTVVSRAVIQGSTGLTSLEYGDIRTEEYEGDIADEPIELSISDFNRTPVVGDKFLLVYHVTESDNTYIAPFTITEVGTTTVKASLDGAMSAKISGESGASDYNALDNIPVINQDLTASDFTPVANTYYRHTGATTDTFTQGVIYLYDTAYHKLGESGGTTLNKYTYSVYITTGAATTDSTNAITLIDKILNNAKSYNCNFAGETALPKTEFGMLYLNAIKHISDGIKVFSFIGSANGINSYTTTIKESGVTHTELSDTTQLIRVTYYNDTEITA